MITPSKKFVKEICKQDPNLYMASLDVDCLSATPPSFQ